MEIKLAQASQKQRNPSWSQLCQQIQYIFVDWVKVWFLNGTTIFFIGKNYVLTFYFFFWNCTDLFQQGQNFWCETGRLCPAPNAPVSGRQLGSLSWGAHKGPGGSAGTLHNTIRHEGPSVPLGDMGHPDFRLPVQLQWSASKHESGCCL